ncbi:MAG: hypothetical protein A2359_03540 [Candidatus Moranbacteria bacterium RIFOXYB1_FULL_43_19]|nr:MAG: hypothetical protein A2359_03540 [Candidatus Moranbacteria bacterium RIFOXYB1_FULL_43_19]OGI27903.1 MAG: hypothetical protein A2184_02695 [Candidatus Moranbacteria bacterium RIFOXYA1_FULL_44_7]OGI32518.1 MAG: hypothetical protein A2420_02995 [Candidatus Moranbacteria bacterium RIFOXYC1_FULL_44_13]OGI38140.1 MAG: hypothetical protein A2612_01280 [Candidatus Moranbacteria bacterium RIFOXYD1_FULL_44_12]
MKKTAKKLFPSFLKRENITALSMIVAIGGISFVLAVFLVQFSRYENLNEARKKRHSAYEDELRRLSGLSVNLTPAPDPTTGWKTYSSQKYNISLRYPQNWQAPRESFAAKGGNYLLKISFDEKGIVSANGVKGFDVFVYSAAKFSTPAATDNLKKKNENVSAENCPGFDDITLGEKGYSAKEVNISFDNPCWEETFFYSLSKNGYTFNIVPRQGGSANIFEDRQKIDMLRNFPEFYDVVSTLDFAEVETKGIAQASKKVVQKVTVAPKVRYTSGASCAHKKDKPRYSKNKGKHMDEDCCPDPDEWPNPRCAYSAKGLAIMISPPKK